MHVQLQRDYWRMYTPFYDRNCPCQLTKSYVHLLYIQTGTMSGISVTDGGSWSDAAWWGTEDWALL